MTAYSVWSATRGDLDEIISLRTEAEDWLRAAGIEQWTDDFHDYARAALADGVDRGVTWVVVDGDAVVATVTLNGPDLDFWQPRYRPESGLYLSKMIVARSHAGQGVGGAVLNWATQRAARAGKTWLRLECRRDNLRLHGYYLRHGFDHVATVVPPNRRTHSGALFQRPAGLVVPSTVALADPELPD
jgi:GNAT superfamily N-acetyltransferase